MYHRPIRLAYKPYFFSQRTVFFSHNKSANSTFSHGLSAKRTGHEVYNYVLCQEGGEDTTHHLFFDCASSVTRWFSFGLLWSPQGSVYQLLDQHMLTMQLPFFIETFVIAAWCIQNESNVSIFNGKLPLGSNVLQMKLSSICIGSKCSFTPFHHEFVKPLVIPFSFLPLVFSLVSSSQLAFG